VSQEEVVAPIFAYKVSKYVFNVALIFNQESFLSTLLAALSINHTISASTGVVFSVAQFINVQILVVVSSHVFVPERVVVSIRSKYAVLLNLVPVRTLVALL
jgi:hypothetical protein